MVTIYMYAFAQFNRIIIAQQNRVGGTISHVIQVQCQLINAPPSDRHDIQFNAHINRQIDRCGIFNFKFINCTS